MYKCTQTAATVGQFIDSTSLFEVLSGGARGQNFLFRKCGLNSAVEMCSSEAVAPKNEASLLLMFILQPRAC